MKDHPVQSNEIGHGKSKNKSASTIFAVGLIILLFIFTGYCTYRRLQHYEKLQQVVDRALDRAGN